MRLVVASLATSAAFGSLRTNMLKVHPLLVVMRLVLFQKRAGRHLPCLVGLVFYREAPRVVLVDEAKRSRHVSRRSGRLA